MNIGGHVSAAGGLHKAFANAETIGAKCMQIFGASPRQWHVSMPSGEVVKAFKYAHKESSVNDVFLHASYLANIASPKKETWGKGVDSLSRHLQIVEMIGANGLVFHIGSTTGADKEVGMENVVKGMKEVLKNVPGSAQLIMENAAGGGSKLGTTFEEIGSMIRAANDPRIKVCLDTAHACGAGLFFC
jgi:deoxyribonuclease IV